MSVSSCQQGTAPAFSLEEERVEYPSWEVQSFVGRKHPCSQPHIGSWGEARRERIFPMFISPANTVSGGSWQVPAAVPLIPCGHPHSPSHVHANILACIYLTGKFYFLSPQGRERGKKKGGGQIFSLGTNLIFKSPDKMSHKITIFQSAL